MSNRDFKVGDILRVRQWDDMAKEFGVIPSSEPSGDYIPCKYSFCEPMKYMCGQQFTVSEIISGIRYFQYSGVILCRGILK